MRTTCQEREEIDRSGVADDGRPGEWIVPLADAGRLRDVGGKAFNLAALIAIRQPVPAGFVVSRAACDALLAQDGLAAAIDGELRALTAATPPRDVRLAAERIAACVRLAVLPAPLRLEIDRAFDGLGSDTVIVRSSGVGEDSAAASFAGQFDSIADVTSRAAVHRAVITVLASRWSARSLTYQLQRSCRVGGMGVIVQRQVDAAISGVLFTVDPACRDRLLIEYCDGPGEALVSGRVTPSQIAVDRRTLAVVHHHGSHDAGAGAVRLDERTAREIAERALQIERALGRPQDIEWTMDRGGRLWIVQTRPITVAMPEETPSSAIPRRTVVWSNANVNENFPHPISPLLYSIARTGYYHYFRNLGIAFGVGKARIAAMEQPLRHIIGVHGARMYYNLTSIHGVLRSAPFGDQLAAWFNGFVGAEDTATAAYVDTSLEGGHARTSARRMISGLRQSVELALIAVKTAWQFAFVTRRVTRFERTVDEFAARTHPAHLRARALQDLAADLRGFIEIRNHRWIDASLADAASMIGYGALERWLARAFPDADRGGLHNTLLKALSDLPSSVPALELWSLSRLVATDPALAEVLATRPAAAALEIVRRDPAYVAFATALDSFIENWGFRCSGELMLTVPSFQEDAAPVLEIIKAYAAQDGPSPADHLRLQQSDRLAQTRQVAAYLRTRRLVGGIPFLSQWHVTSPLLASTQRAIVLRERARLKQALLYSRLRRIALAIGERLVDDGHLQSRDDVFMLTAQEIDDVVCGAAMFPQHVRALADARRAWFAEVTAVPPPDSLRLAEGTYFVPAAARGAAENHGRPAVLQGLGVCGGRTTARAAVLNDVTDTGRLRKGDVLVTRQTDPGWGAVFPLISGLIMERGGMLSHGAIIAREFGIPSIAGVPRATEAIPHGTEVDVDGDRGTVRLRHTPVDAPPGERHSAAAAV